MRRKIKLIWLLVAFIACTATYGRAQSKQKDSLNDYLQMAVIDNPAVQQKLDEFQAALQRLPQVGSLSDPDLTVGVFLKPMELAAGNQLADIQLMQMFPWFGVLRHAKDEMSLMANAKFEAFRETRNQVYYDVQRTWYDLQKNQRELQLYEENVALLKTIERLTRIRFSVGVTNSQGVASSDVETPVTSTGASGSSGMSGMNSAATVTAGASSFQRSSSMPAASMGAVSTSAGLADLYRIQIEISDLENEMALLKNRQISLTARFNSYLNRPVASPVSVDGKMEPDTLEILATDSLLANNPMLGMLAYEKRSLEARGKMINRMGYPMIGIGLDYALITKNEMSASPMNGKDMLMPMLKVTLPVYRRKYKAMQQETRLLKSASTHDYTATANQLQADYVEALRAYQDARREMELYKQQRQLAKTSLDILIKTFSVSGTGLTEILQLQKQLLGYDFNYIETVARNNTAIAWLNKLMAATTIQSNLR